MNRLVWSTRHEAWWCRGGYTSEVALASLYTAEQAEHIEAVSASATVVELTPDEVAQLAAVAPLVRRLREQVP